MQVLLANACSCDSASSFFFVIFVIDFCKYILIKVAENIYYHYYYRPASCTCVLHFVLAVIYLIFWHLTIYFPLFLFLFFRARMHRGSCVDVWGVHGHHSHTHYCPI